MKAFTKRALAALALAAVVAGPATAMTVKGDVYSNVRNAISGSGNINVTVSDGIATLTGNAEHLDRVAAQRAALKSEGVTRVVNLIDAS